MAQRGVPRRGRPRRRAAGLRASSSPRRSRSDEIEELYGDRIVDERLVRWNARDGAVLARRRRRLGALRARGQAARQARSGEGEGGDAGGRAPARPGRAALERRAAELAPAHRLPASHRRELARPVRRGAAGLARRLAGPFLDGVSRRDHLARIDLASAFAGAGAVERAARSSIAWHRRISKCRAARACRSTMPTRPSPRSSVRLQEMFGLTDTPRIGGGRCRSRSTCSRRRAGRCR